MKITKKRDISKSILAMLESHRFDIQKYKVKKLGLFGSCSKRSYGTKSDIDFLVRFDEPTFDNYMNLKFLLEKLFHKKIDLVMEDSLKPSLRYVKKEAQYVKRL